MEMQLQGGRLGGDDGAEQDAGAAKRRRTARAALWLTVGAVLLGACIQGQVLATRKGKGAIHRWRGTIAAFWAGQDIYLTRGEAQADEEGVALHPNMPAAVILLTPFAKMPLAVAAAAVNVLKAALVVMAIAMAWSLFGGRQRVPTGALGLALVAAAPAVVGDFQHANTNVFAMGFLVLHMWLSGRGRDVLAGGALALAVCVKVTPALFLPYWLYQRNWKLLGGAAAGLVLLVAAMPAALLGTARAAAVTTQWGDRLVLPNVGSASWYPQHVNQSLSGVISRYTLGGRGGDIFWNPEHDPDYKGSQHGWINFASLDGSTAAGLLTAARAAVLALLAGAIGWRRADRGGPQRALHYALVLAAMMLINQRTWDHHTAVLLPAYVAVWYAVYRAPLGRGARAAAGTATAAAMALVYLTRADVIGGVARLVGAAKAQAKVLADYVEAYGPGFWQLVMVLVVAAGLLIGWRLAERRGGERAAP